MESYAFDYLDAPVERVAGADVPMPYAHGLEKARARPRGPIGSPRRCALRFECFLGPPRCCRGHRHQHVGDPDQLINLS